MSVASAASPEPDVAASLRTLETSWPLAGSTEFVHLAAEWRSTHAIELASNLRRHVMETWFPRCIDVERGGFFCDFDGRWRLRGQQVRMLEFQARQTRTAARLGRAFPAESRWLDYARHGITYLDGIMRDAEHGGWYWLVDREGRAQANGTKHGHSTAYLISAYVEAYRLIGDASLLESAKAAFMWLESALHDAEHGGYRTWSTRSGKPILTHADGALPADATDPLGHGVGLKDANVHSDLLEGLRLLYLEWPDPTVRARLVELHEIFVKQHGSSDGSMHYLLTDDLTPVPSPERFGYPLQAGARLIRLAPLIGLSPDAAMTWAVRGLDHVLRDGRSPAGGIADIPPAAVATRPWWVQSEASQLLLIVAANVADNEPYVRAHDDLSGFVDREFLDRSLGGWYPIPRGEWGLGARLVPARLPKAHRWKDASHETDAYLNGIRILRGVPDSAALE